MLERLARLDDASTEAALDLTRCRYIGPDAAVLLAAALIELRRRRVPVLIKWPSGPHELRAFCQFSGLLELYEELTPYTQKDYDPTHNVLRLRILTEATFRDAEPVINLVRAHVGIPEDTEEYLRICVNEVIQNIVDHAASPIGGFICARFMTKSNEVRIAIADRGLGIYTTLRRVYPDTTPKSALERVLAGKFTAQSRQNNAGLGINHLKGILKNLGGQLCIISGSAMATMKPGRVDISELEFTFGGTAVFFTIPVQNV